jgi:hypothetical protein
MKNLSTGFGLCVAAAAALAYPFVSSLAPSANASAVTGAASAVSTAATAQTGPTIVWYGTTAAFAGFSGNGSQLTRTVIIRAWSDGRVEMCRVAGGEDNWCSQSPSGAPCVSMWYVISDPAQGLTFRSDINFDEQVNGADLGQILADWGDAPRQSTPPSDCPLNLVNP